MNEFSLDPQAGWVQGFAAAKVLFPDLAEKINEFFSPHWPRLREIVKGMDRPDPEYLSALTILGANKAWIDETGEFHIEFKGQSKLSPHKPLPERLSVWTEFL